MPLQPAMPEPTTSVQPEVSIVIPHYNDLTGLDRCLAALGQQTTRMNNVEIIVADNMSPAGYEAVSAIVRGRAQLIIASERGAGPARNAGVAASRAPILAFTDSDCVPEPQWLASGLAALSQHDVVGGRVKVLVDHARPLHPVEAFEAVFAFDNRNYIERKGFTGAGNMFCSRAVFDATGPFRVGMSEDLEWSHRARAAGFTLGYSEAAAVGHPARENWEQLVRKWARINRETFALGRPTLSHRLRFLARGWLMPLSVVAHAPRIFRTPALASPRDRWAALMGLAGIRLWRMLDCHRILFGSRF
jgi:glycosyltransferase involved in cell wall biosynthesis